MGTDNNWVLEIERALLKETLEKRVGDKPSVSNVKLNPILLPDSPKENWAYRGRKLNPIYLPGQYK